MACQYLNCHITILYYRIKRGDITPVKIRGMRYLLLEDVIDLKKHNPVRSKPHWSKVSAVSVAKPTLWQRIKALFV